VPELVERLFSEAGFELSPEELKRFRVYLEELKRWNRVHNLTSIRKDEEIVRRHFIDSLSLVRCFEDLSISWKGKELADVGSGAGFPGVPLKIYLKDIDLFLIESVSKKCSFLEYLKLKLSMEWDVICDRAERVERQFDIVVSRAMGEFEDIHGILEGLAREHVFVMKGREFREEWVHELGYKPCLVNIKGLPPSYVLWKRIT